MNKLKYIKLFEAFESNKLSKTLKFIDKDSRRNFLGKIKSLCEGMDFPLSKISDDLFEYLPYKKAIETHKEIPDVPCTATSETQFGSASIEGEKCQGGKVKRTWGPGRVRVMECTHCGGTGIEPFVPKWKYLKFWFNLDRKFVATTATDGTKHGGDYETSIFRHDNLVRISYGSISFQYQDVEDDIERSLKTATFALVLDLDKLELKSDEIEDVSVTNNNRRKSRDGAVALMRDEDIKSANIEKYFNEIIERGKIKGNFDDIKNSHKLFMRILCGDKILFALHSNSNNNNLFKIISLGDSIYEIMLSLQKVNTVDTLVNRIDDVNYTIRRTLLDNNIYKKRINKSLELTKSLVNSDLERTKDYRYSKLFNNIMKINDIIYRYISNYKVDNLYEFDSLLLDLKSIQDLMDKRRYGLYVIRVFFERTTSRWNSDDAKYYITDARLTEDDLESALEGTDRFIYFLENKYSI